MRRRVAERVVTCALLSACVSSLAAVGGCGDFANTDKAADGRSNGFSDAGANPGQGAAGGGGGGPVVLPDGGLPPETELTVDLQLPQASQHFVYAANPQAGTVAVIDAQTLSIRTVETGERPTYLRTLADRDDAIVLNIGSDTATVIRSASSKSTTSDLPVVPGANAIGIAPDSKHAVVYFNSTYASAESGSGSFQDVTVLTLSADGKDTATNMTVGFRPRDAVFSNDGKRAFVVTEDGISTLDFAQIEKQGSGIAKLLSFGGDVDQKTLDVAVTPDGAYGLARAQGKSELRLVRLSDGQVKTLDLSELMFPVPSDDGDADGGTSSPASVDITDLDLMPDGKRAIAVLRNQSAMVILPLPEAFDDVTALQPIVVGKEVVGSITIAPDGKRGLLYTTAANLERATIVTFGADAPSFKTVALRKAVSAVAFTPDSATAVITNTKLAGDPLQTGISPDDSIDRSFGYTLMRVATGDVKLQVTKTSVGPIAMVPDGSYLFVSFRNDLLQVKEVHRVALASFLIDPIIQLESPPISIGAAQAAHKVFVNQDHPDGRMTFIDWKNPDNKNTVTGFELNSRIRD